MFHGNAEEDCPLAVVAGKKLTTNMLLALPMVIAAIGDLRATLPVGGAVKIAIPGSAAAIFVVSGNSGPGKDVAILEAALEAAGMVKGEDGYAPK